MKNSASIEKKNISSGTVNEKPHEFVDENPDKEIPPIHEHKEDPPVPASKPV